jgi:uncharacterized protein YegJ (DUF2314 family)
VRYFILFFIITACTPASRTNDASHQEKMSVLEDSFISAVVIFPLDETITLATGIAKAKELMPQFKAVDEIPDALTYDGYKVTFSQPGDEDFTLPKPDEMAAALGYLSADEVQELASTRANIVFTFFGPSKEVVKKQHSINDLVYALLQNKKAFALDMSTFELFGPAAWKTHRIESFNEEQLDITSQVTLHSYREEAYCRVVSLGMNKFALPEISLRDFPCSDSNPFGNLVNATLQSLYESPFIQADSTLTIDIPKIRNEKIRVTLIESMEKDALQKAAIHLTYAEPEEGDNPSTQLRIAFDPEQGSIQQQAKEVIDLLFGATDSITYIKHNEELMQVSREARTHLPDMKKLFLAGLKPGYSIMVKVPFPTGNDGSNEWMWVEVTQWNSGRMEGILQNDPYEIPDLKAGSLVKFEEADIFDYLLNKPDGTFEGNETSKIIEKMN